MATSTTKKIGSIRIAIASPEYLRSLSSGEVKKPETINYRTFKPERDGLFCERIFGTTKDYECSCGKYNGKKYEGTVCERCGVRVESKEARRRRMGHIELASPVVHIWYLKSTPSILSTLLNMSSKDLEKVIYFGSHRIIEKTYLVTNPKATMFEKGDMLYETEYNIYKSKWDFEAEIAVRVRNPRGPVRSGLDGIVSLREEETNTGRYINWVTVRETISEEYPVYPGMVLEFKDGEAIEKGEEIVKEQQVPPIYAPFDGNVKVDELTNTIRLEPLVTSKEQPIVYVIPHNCRVLVKDGQKIKKGDQITTEGYLPPVVANISGKLVFDKNLSIQGREDGKYEVRNTAKVYIERVIQEKDYPIMEGSIVYVKDGDQIKKGDIIADRFLYDDEILSTAEYKIFDSHYSGEFDIETNVENDRPIVMITEIDPEISKEIGKNVGDIIVDNEYEAYKTIYPGKIEAETGAMAIKKLLQKTDLEKLRAELEAELQDLPKSSTRALKLLKRLKVVKDFIKSGNKPEWMILEVIPVLPPDLRPMIQIEGGRFATTDLNDLYRRVINRNNRLKKLMDLGVPDIIVRNEKRMLQEAVDSLIYNGRMSKPITDRGGRPLKSLTDMVKGKKGRFRRNLLGKRVDYSGRAVIVVGPELKMHECGIPKKMAMELFKPFVLAKLIKDDTSKSARKLKRTIIEKEMPQAWEILEEVIKDHPVLLNRAPTLHRISIQAFIPKLVEGNAIRLHPLVCPPFNADFDGDQMAVHVPLSAASQAEARFLMFSRYNIISPAHGEPLSMPGKDIIVGSYYLTAENPKLPESKIIFSSPEEAFLAKEFGYIGLHTPIKVNLNGKLVKTTYGRLIFNEIIPEDMRDYSKTFGKKQIKELVFNVFKKYGIDRTADLLDDIKDLGFHYSTISGLTISIKDVKISPKKYEIIEHAKEKVQKVEDLYERGFLSPDERYRQVIKIWEDATEAIQQVTYQELSKDSFNPLYMMVNSGARGNIDQVKQLAGMRGLMADPSGKTIEIPITSNFREGLDVIEFFISTHGARKGSADTALRTSNAGYLTRRLVDVAQSITINTTDCGTKQGIEAKALRDTNIVIEPLEKNIFGRVLAEDVLDPETKEILRDPLNPQRTYIRDTMLNDDDARFLANYKKQVKVYYQANFEPLKANEPPKVYSEIAEDVYSNDGILLFKAGTIMNWELFKKLREHNIESVKLDCYPVVDTVTCEDVRSKDGKFEVVKIEEKIDPVVAKLLRENAIDSVLVRPSIIIRSVLTCEAENGVCAKCYGMDLSNHKIVNIGEAVGIVAAQSIGEPGTQLTMRTFHTGGIATTADITQGLPRAEELFEARKKLKEASGVFSEVKGFVKDIRNDEKGSKIYIEDYEGRIHEYTVPSGTKPKVEVGQKVVEGMELTTGAIRPKNLMASLGVRKAEEYLLKEIKRVYAEQGVDIHNKHIEIIIRQMFAKVEITDPGDTGFLPGDLVAFTEIRKLNEEIMRNNSKVDMNRAEAIGKILAHHILIEEDHEIKEIAKEGDEITQELLEKLINKGVKEIEILTESGQKKTLLINPNKPAKYVRRLLRITKASLEHSGWLSAASFQQTPQVLTEAAVEGRIDKLQGLKENVIVGQLIPAGTGLESYRGAQIEESEIAVEKTTQADDQVG
ncbi:MAG TPA: DNA-directed RNA polymerase subunit beta' [Thermotogaceae bacterium]|nr:DNA-directed RNA polymerase subunit beta' [Thermotogaceae bacterium]